MIDIESELLWSESCKPTWLNGNYNDEERSVAMTDLDNNYDVSRNSSDEYNTTHKELRWKRW